MIDDSPECIIKGNATIIPVSKYLHHVDLLDHNFIDHIDESYHKIMYDAIKNDEKYIIKNDIDYSKDCELLSIMNQLNQLFY
jgi:hypothetical protein